MTCPNYAVADWSSLRHVIVTQQLRLFCNNYESDGRKRSMSLWVEFITASGYLSSRKIRARFQTLMSSALEKSRFSSILTLCPQTTDVVLSVSGSYCIRIIPAFRCGGMWPRSAQNWPRCESNAIWPPPPLVTSIKNDGFSLLSRDGLGGDSWVLAFADAETKLVDGGNRKVVLSVLKTLRERHLDVSVFQFKFYCVLYRSFGHETCRFLISLSPFCFTIFWVKA